MRKRLILVAVLLVAAIVVLTPITALAAMYATISSDHARPGDSVLVLSEDFHGASDYTGLSDENHQAIYLAPTTSPPAAACGGPSSHMVERLHSRGNAAARAFIVPNIELEDYWLFMEARRQCCRLAAPGAPRLLMLR